jgi:hypothetical protein
MLAKIIQEATQCRRREVGRKRNSGSMGAAYFGDALRGFGAHQLIVRYDTRGFGLSDRGTSDYSLDVRVRDLEAVTDALNLKCFSIYASFGGPMVIAYAARHPERIAVDEPTGPMSRFSPVWNRRGLL